MSAAPPPKRKRSGATGAAKGRRPVTRLPLWTVAIIAVLFVPVVLLHEPVFGAGAGGRAAGLGVLFGLIIGVISTRWRWDFLSTTAAVLATHFLVGGAAALPETAIFGVIPTGQTLQLLVLQVVDSWLDLLTVTPPAGAYIGPAVMPWIVGLLCALASTILTLRFGWVVAGTLPIALMGFVGIAWGEAGTRPTLWPVLVWGAAVLVWWSWAAQRKRFDRGIDIQIGRKNVENTGNTGVTSGATRLAVHAGTRVIVAAVTVVCLSAVAMPITSAIGPWNSRIVLRDLVDPPLDPREYSTPLAAFRHYSTDLEKETILTASGVPEGARLRIGVMDTYNGTTMGIATVGTYENGGYMHVGPKLPAVPVPEGSQDAEISVSTLRILGPWLPTTGSLKTFRFTDDDGGAQQDGLRVDRWADAALTTAPATSRKYTFTTSIAPTWSDGQLTGLSATPYLGQDTGVPSAVAELASTVASKEKGALDKARAIERHLSEQGFFSNEGTADSRPGHRTDRIARMLGNAQLIGDDEQYSVLMALMLHSLGINARVVMGAYSPDKHGTVEYLGEDIRAWVEVHFDGVGWAVFDPTPPRDQVPQTDIPKPRSVPRPQVLQPPEPPEEPAELPPATTDKGTDPSEDDNVQIPWLIIISGTSIVLLLVLPVLLILSYKMRRRSRRRKGTPTAALTGSWSEVVDMARDAGVTLQPNLTRQEAAWILAESLWRNQGPTGTPAKRGRTTTADIASQRGVAQWAVEGSTFPRTVVVARGADFADFAEGEPSPQAAQAAWFEVDQLTIELAQSTPWWKRLGRALSLNSWRAARRRRKADRRAKRLEEQNRAQQALQQRGPVEDALGARKKRAVGRRRKGK